MTTGSCRLIRHIRKCLTSEVLGEINEMIMRDVTERQDQESKHGDGPGDASGLGGNSGTMIVDGTCAPSHIRYLQDASLLNEDRENAEGILDALYLSQACSERLSEQCEKLQIQCQDNPQSHWEVERLRELEGHYHSRILADKIYRNRDHLRYCNERGIRLYGPALGRPRVDEVRDKAQDYFDEFECVNMERRFSHAKRKCDRGLVTAAYVIAMSVLVLTLRRDKCAPFRVVMCCWVVGG